jgi:hypothetical protein
MHERALRGYENALGAKHKSTLMTVNNLGNLYREQGKLAKLGWEQALGQENIKAMLMLCLLLSSLEIKACASTGTLWLGPITCILPDTIFG